MAEALKRPGGELASRPLHFFWVVDCSGSMYGEKIGTVNHAIQSKLLHLPWGKKAVRIAISIGQDADDDVLQQFTGNRELVLQANNPQALVKMIKWASTAASLVSAPASRPKEMDVVPAGNNTPSATNAPLVLDMNNIPDPGSIGANDVW